MDTNTFIFGFSILIFVMGILTVVFTSQEFKKMSEGRPPEKPEQSGPRNFMADQFIDLFSDPDQRQKISEEKKKRIEAILREQEQNDQD